MPTITNVLDRLFPLGTNPGSGVTKRIDCPCWPPDLFACTATLLDVSGAYSFPRHTAGWDAAVFAFNDPYPKDVSDAAEQWVNSGTPPDKVKDSWLQLRSFKSAEICECSVGDDWVSVATFLLGVADTACFGVGFQPPNIEKQDFGFIVYKEHREMLDSILKAGVTGRNPRLPYLPHSLCIMVPSTDLCVQPKTNTPKVGCTIRSLSHNLALLPPKSVVGTEWIFAQPNIDQNEYEGPLNVLLVPFPYIVRGADFTPASDSVDARDRYFNITPSWLYRRDNNEVPSLISPADVVSFISSLVILAELEVGTVHAIVMPEGVLLRSHVREIADELGKKFKSLELFITGTCSIPGNGIPRNEAYTCRYIKGDVLKDWFQSKHHRWCIDRSQIERYHFGHALDPDVRWWEKIELHNRSCTFSVIRPGASLAVLVCEDLARYDPVLPIINAIGPNLVIALLMDGPQMERRWPGRYATSLADDPGSSVLTLSCVGMISRSSMPGERAPRNVALWKEPGGGAKELKIDEGDHAVVLSLAVGSEEQFTLDRRGDGQNSRVFRLMGARGVRINRRNLSWPELD